AGPRLAAAAAPHPPAADRLVGFRDSRALEVSALPGRHAARRCVGAARGPDAARGPQRRAFTASLRGLPAARGRPPCHRPRALLRPLLTEPFSADNMDYVPRDSYICGLAGGPVDIQRILHYSFISKEGLTLHDRGAEALFMFLSARLYLYNQVYFHRTVRRI